MKFSCEKALLQAAVNIASRAASTKSSIPALEGLLLHLQDGSLTVCGYNMQTGIRTRLEVDERESGADIVLNARLFGDIIRRMPDDVVVVSSDEKLLVTLTCGESSFHVVGLPAADFPELPEVEEEETIRLPQKTLRAMISQTSFAVSTNEARPVHTGALFEVEGKTLTIVAVDGFRLALRRETLESEVHSAPFVAPGNALNEVEKICEESDDTAEIIAGRRHILFRIGDTELICRRLEGEFLDYRRAIPRNNPVSLLVDTRSLRESIDRVSVVISEQLKSPVRCVLEENRILLFAKTANGEASDSCAVSGDGKKIEIGFNNRYLMDALRYVPADTVRMELTSGIAPCILLPVDADDESFLYMVLPVRMKA